MWCLNFIATRSGSFSYTGGGLADNSRKNIDVYFTAVSIIQAVVLQTIAEKTMMYILHLQENPRFGMNTSSVYHNT